MKKLLLSLGFLPLLLTSCNNGKGALTVTYFNVGKADAILINYKDTNMVIDTGTKDSSKYFIDSLKAKNITEIDCLILSHFDQDHVGGAAELLSNFKVKEIYQTYESDKVSSEIASYKMALTKENITPTVVSEDFTYTLGDITYNIYPPKSDSYSNSQSNNSSLCVKAIYDNTSFLFPGDAEKDRLKELMKQDIKADVLKVPHHGREEDNSKKFFTSVSAKYAIITDSLLEPADTSVINNLELLKTSIYYTKNGDVIVTSNGVNINIKQ